MRVSDGLGAVVRYEYDSLNRRTRETRLLSEGLTQRVDYHYDPAGRLIEVEQSADQEGCGSQFASTRYEYDRNGNIIRIQLPAGGEILREYDAANRLIAETHREERSGIDNRTQFGYDAAGNLTEITDNQGRKTRIAYDLLNREIRRIERDGGVQRTIYDRNGQVVRLIRPNEYDAQTDSGDGFQFTYDAQGRVLTVLSPDGHVLQSNTYDADGRLLQRLDGVGSGVKYEYDLAGGQPGAGVRCPGPHHRHRGRERQRDKVPAGRVGPHHRCGEGGRLHGAVCLQLRGGYGLLHRRRGPHHPV